MKNAFAVRITEQVSPAAALRVLLSPRFGFGCVTVFSCDPSITTILSLKATFIVAVDGRKVFSPLALFGRIKVDDVFNPDPANEPPYDLVIEICGRAARVWNCRRR